MTVPGFQDIMLPLLRALSDDQEWTLTHLEEHLAKHFDELTEEERRRVLPSGNQTRFRNRIAWACTYLRKGGLIESPRRGRNRITDRGRQVLLEQPDRLDKKYLEQYPEYLEFIGAGEADLTSNDQERTKSVDELTPEELLDLGHQRMITELSESILERLHKCSPDFFEVLVLDLMVAMGYGGSVAEAAEQVGRSGDGGIDGTIKEDRLGLGIIYVQAKRWQSPVGPNTVREFYGSLAGQKAEKGVLLTTAPFTKGAIEFANQVGRIVLVDGGLLARLMIEHGVGVSQTASYSVCRIDTDYFEYDE